MDHHKLPRVNLLASLKMTTIFLSHARALHNDPLFNDNAAKVGTIILILRS